MSSQVFYRKWRPQTLAELVGQEHVTRTLLNALASQHISHAYLFCGPRGTGKTSTARNLAKAVNCLTNGKGEPCNACAMCQAITEGRALDVIEVDAASNRRIEEIRQLRERVNYAPNQARYKVYIIDEVHMLTNEAANALLKTLEEPPPYIIFILATTEAHKLLATILSRCQRFDFRRISQADVMTKLSRICENEGIHIEPEGLRLIARAATGSLRDAENLLQQLTTHYGTDIKPSQVKTMLGIASDGRAKELIKHIVANDIPAGMATINSINRDGLDLRQFHREMVACLRALLLTKTGSGESIDLTTEDLNELKELAARTSLPQVIKAVKLFGQLELGLDNYATLPLELALVDCTMTAADGREEPHRADTPTARTVPEPAATKKPAPPHETVASKTTPPATETTTTRKPATPPETAALEKPAAPAPAGAEAKPPVASAPTPLEAGSPIEQLRTNWRKFILEAPGSIGKTPAAALLRSAVPKAIEDDTIVLSFRFAFHKEKMEQPENQKTAEKIISGFLGRTCHLRCLHEPENNHLVKAALRMGAQIIEAEEK